MRATLGIITELGICSHIFITPRYTYTFYPVLSPPPPNPYGNLLNVEILRRVPQLYPTPMPGLSRDANAFAVQRQVTTHPL